MLILSKCINLEVQDIKNLMATICEPVISEVTTADGTGYVERQIEELNLEPMNT